MLALKTQAAVRLNLGCGRHPLDGWTNLDRTAGPGVDIVADLEEPLALETGSVDEFMLSHVIEHIREPLALMQELHRVARPNAIATIRVPYGSSDDAWEDPTHVRPYFLSSWGYFSQPFYWRADYGYRGDWLCEQIYLQVSRSRISDEDPGAIMKMVRDQRNVVQEMIAILKAQKPIRKPLRELQVSPQVLIELI